MMYKVIKSLIFEAKPCSYNFIGCTAEIFHELPSKVAVKFYGGSPVMLDKEHFFASVEESTEKEMQYHDILDVTIFQRKPNTEDEIYPTQVVRIIALEGEDHQQKAEQRLKELFNYTKGLNYHSFEIKVIESIGNKLNNKKMAKKTEVTVFEQAAEKINLPAIPKVMNIGGLEFSEEAIKKEVDAVKKILIKDPSLPESQKVYQELVKKKNEFVKTRTAPEKFRKDISAPINSWIKELKAQTDAYGSLAQEGQAHCEEQIAIFENWEAEQKRLAQEAQERLLQERREKLQASGGFMNVASLSWTFEHSPETLIENHDLADMDDYDFNELLANLEGSYIEYQAKEKAKKEAMRVASQALISARKQILQLMQYTETPNGFEKNGHVVSEPEMESLSDTEWMNLLQSHNTPKVVENPFKAKDEVATPIGSNPFATTESSVVDNNPFSQATSTVSGNPFEAANQIPVTPSTLGDLFGENLFIDVSLSEKSMIRLFQTKDYVEANKGVTVSFTADFKNGLSIIIYKK